MPDFYIHVYESTSEVGYFYDIYKGDPHDAAEDAEPIEGGFCTTTAQNALSMAHDALAHLIKHHKNIFN